MRWSEMKWGKVKWRGATRRNSTWWYDKRVRFARLTATGRVLTGALRSPLSLKYRRQFGGWFGCPIHLYHHRSVTYGFSSLLFSSLSFRLASSRLFSSLLYSSPLSLSSPFYLVHSPICSILLWVSLPWPPCLRPTIRTPTKLHPLLSPFFLSYSFASPPSTTNEPRACQIQSHLLILGSNLSLRVVFFVS